MRQHFKNCCRCSKRARILRRLNGRNPLAIRAKSAGGFSERRFLAAFGERGGTVVSCGHIVRSYESVGDIRRFGSQPRRIIIRSDTRSKCGQAVSNAKGLCLWFCDLIASTETLSRRRQRLVRGGCSMEARACDIGSVWSPLAVSSGLASLINLGFSGHIAKTCHVWTPGEGDKTVTSPAARFRGIASSQSRVESD